MNSVSEAIKKARKSKGLTQKDLGNLLGVSEVMIGQYERGVRNPKIEMLSKIAAALNVPLTSLLPDDLASEEHEREFRKACEVLDDAGFFIEQDEKDSERGVFQICHHEHGTVAVESEDYIINLVKQVVTDSISIQDEYIVKRLQLELLTGK
jgi:transcriptional regulator with XRE-family HTH domain